jgi:hypothetical protein
VRPQEELSLEAAERVVRIQSRYAAAGIGLAQAALAGARELHTLRHYPAGDACDAASGSEFYYHAHGSRRPHPDEHGHFHLFVRREGHGFFHLAALSLDARGLPLRWFTTNGWVTGERWVDAHTVIAALPSFHPNARGRLAPVAAWLDAMVTLYADTLARLLRRRDAVIARRAAGRSLEAVLEDRRLDVVTESRLAFPSRLSRIAGIHPSSPGVVA